MLKGTEQSEMTTIRVTNIVIIILHLRSSLYTIFQKEFW